MEGGTGFKPIKDRLKIKGSLDFFGSREMKKRHPQPEIFIERAPADSQVGAEFTGGEKLGEGGHLIGHPWSQSQIIK